MGSRSRRPIRSKEGRVGGRYRRTSKYGEIAIDEEVDEALTSNATSKGCAIAGLVEIMGARSIEVIAEDSAR